MTPTKDQPSERAGGSGKGAKRPSSTSRAKRQAAARKASFADREARLSAAEARERRQVRGAARGTVHQTLVTTGEFYRGLGVAIAESFDAFVAALDPDEVEAQGVSRTTFDAVAEGNARFYDSLADSSRRVFDELRPAERPVRPTREPIDYERLAKLVADELRGSSAAS